MQIDIPSWAVAPDFKVRTCTQEARKMCYRCKALPPYQYQAVAWLFHNTYGSPLESVYWTEATYEITRIIELEDPMDWEPDKPPGWSMGQRHFDFVWGSLIDNGVVLKSLDYDPPRGRERQHLYTLNLDWGVLYKEEIIIPETWEEKYERFLQLMIRKDKYVCKYKKDRPVLQMIADASLAVGRGWAAAEPSPSLKRLSRMRYLSERQTVDGTEYSINLPKKISPESQQLP